MPPYNVPNFSKSYTVACTRFVVKLMRARPLARRLPPRASAAGPLIPFTCLYVVSVWVVSALRLRGRVFTEWALDRV